MLLLMIRIIMAAAWIAISSTLAAEPTAEAKDGNIILRYADGEAKTFTKSGKESL